MRHRVKKTKVFNNGIQKRSLVVRSLLTNLVRNWQIVTTSQKSFVLQAYADRFFARLVRLAKTQDEKTARREMIRFVKSVIFTEKEWKKVVNDIVPSLLQASKTSWFVSCHKMWQRKWDGAEEVLVKIL